MPKDIAVFLDGTWNSKAAVEVQRKAVAKGRLHSADKADPNVATLFDACTLSNAQKRYLTGVGGLRDEPASRLARALWKAEARLRLPVDHLPAG